MCVLQLIATSCPAPAKQSRTLWLFLLLLLLLLPSLFGGRVEVTFIRMIGFKTSNFLAWALFFFLVGCDVVICK